GSGLDGVPRIGLPACHGTRAHSDTQGRELAASRRTDADSRHSQHIGRAYRERSGEAAMTDATSRDLAKQLRDNATVLLAPGTAIPTGAIAGALRMAADEIERLTRKLDTCGLQCSATLKSLVAENEELRRELAREVGTRAARVAEIDA